MTKKKSAAEELIDHRDDVDEWDEAPVDVAVRLKRSEVVSFRLPREEMDALEEAAQSAGQTLSQFIRTAIRMRNEGPQGDPATLDVTAGRASLMLSFHSGLRWSRTDAEHSISVPDFPPAGVNTTN